MKVYSYGSLAQWWEDRQRADAVQWTRLSAEATEHINAATGRDDLIVTMEPGSGHGAPAVYVAGTADIEVNPDVCAPGVDPADIDLVTEAGQLRHSELVGALDHEGGHGEFSGWPIDQSPAMRRVMQAALLLEEPLMERDVVAARPGRRVFLRSSFHKIAMRGLDEIDTVPAAAHIAALVHGRVDAGVLTEAEVAAIIEVCRSVIGAERYDALRRVWLDGMALPVPRTDTGAMADLGRRWLEILGDDAEDDGDGDEGASGVFICGQDADSDADSGSGSGSGSGESVGDAMRRIASMIDDAAKAEAEAGVEAAKARDAVAAKNAQAAADAKDDAAAREVFSGDPRFVGHGAGRGDEGLSGERDATPEEVAQANQLAARLRKAQHRERTKVVTGSVVPPGRLRSSQAVRRSAERSMGMLSSAEPWRQVRRRHVDSPPITVAVGCDISGSMSWASAAVASAAWMIARAVHRNEGDTATVAYGERVHAVVRPGEKPARVRLFNANGGRENWTGAMRALNGALHLEHGSGARLAVFISDGHYTGLQRAEGNRMAMRLMAAGVKVLWIGFEGESRDVVVPGAEYVRIRDPREMGSVIGDAMVRLLERA